MKKQIEKSTFENISKAVSGDVATECGGFKFGTNAIPIYCPACGNATLIALEPGVYMCTTCGGVIRTSVEEK